MNTAQLLDDLHAELATSYPTRRALSARPGRVSCVVIPTEGQYDTAPCEPPPVTVTAEVHILAAGMDEQAVKDLPHHLDPVGLLIRKAGWTCTGWRSGTALDQPIPELVITATALGTG